MTRQHYNTATPSTGQSLCH